ncbi:phytase [Eleftheria terrae]|uniref:phytase n=1 Tax=Eleftheria terrae TaxID=1597781 RepID=UPI00263B6131|nr:phytase [Eleftheria terrae]WKB53460.1 phytase [Eleftheria terrae]
MQRQYSSTPPARRRRLPLLAASTLAAWLAACGGGGGTAESAQDAGPGAPAEAQAQHAAVGPIQASHETPRETGGADMDDPAVWVHPDEDDAEDSLIVAAAKKGGLRVYDLKGRPVQTIAAQLDAEGEPLNRFNNVDVAYRFKLGGKHVDIAVASDRIQDKLRVWRIDEDYDLDDGEPPLVDATSATMPRLFPTRPAPDDREHGSVPNPNDGKHTAYGLALYRDKASGKVYAFVNQNNEAVIAQYELVDDGHKKISARLVREWRFPYTHRGQDLTQEDENDPARDFSPQFEGMVVDQQTGILYAAQEDVGIWRINVKTGVAEDRPFYETRAFDPNSRVARDVEGLTIYYAAGGKGYLLASSQGKAHGEPPTQATPGLDDTFVVFERQGQNRLLGSFRVEPQAGKGIDGVQESDGSDVSNVALPGFKHGLFIAQDGYDNDVFDGSETATNLKLVPWDTIATRFPGGPLTVDTGYNPRRP